MSTICASITDQFLKINTDNSDSHTTVKLKTLVIGLTTSMSLLLLLGLSFSFCVCKSRRSWSRWRTWFINEPDREDEYDRGRRSMEIPTPFIDRVATPTFPPAKGVSTRDQLLSLRIRATETPRQKEGVEILEPPRSAVTSSDGPPSYNTL